MKRTLTIALLIAALVAAPKPADAGVRSKLKKVAHAVTTTAGIVVGVVVVIALCSKGDCAFR